MSLGTTLSFTPHPTKQAGSGRPTLWTFSQNGLLVSQSHHFNKRGGFYDEGGPFYTYKKSREANSVYLDWFKNGVEWKDDAFALGLSSTAPSSFTPVPWASQQSKLTADYATGFRRTRPGNPVAGLGQFLIELRDIPRIPLLHFKKMPFFRSLGNEYLNVVFGWKPFVNDLRKMYHLWHTIDKRMAQIIRENGHGIRRKATIANDTSTTQTISNYSSPFVNCSRAPPTWTNGTTQYQVTTTTETKVWFVGKYQYYIPDVGSSLWTKKARLALFGALPTPELIWEVLPWSWLIDWFSNVGDIISNLSPNAVDNLVCRYSYIMRHEKTTVENLMTTTWVPLVVGNTNIPGGSASLYVRDITEAKMRQGGGNPFGLNVQLSSLSNYQMGILAALGLSRGLVK